MCSKHKACHTGAGVQSKAGGSCATAGGMTIKSIGADSAGSDEGSCCETKTSCCTAPDLAEESDSTQSGTGITRSWIVAGMDCPACARKIEKAVSSVPGANNVRVLFATEKLVVELEELSLTQKIEAAVTKAGFSIGKSTSSQTATVDLSMSSLFRQNIQVLSLSVAMLISFLVSPLWPGFSEGAFAAICVLGLIPIARNAISSARAGSPFSIETLMSVAALGALYLGETTEAAMVLLLFLLGEKLEAFASNRARKGVQSLMELVPEQATKIVSGERIVVAANELEPGDLIEASPGDRLAADGLLENPASFDESALTGESLPVERGAGEPVMAGSVLVDRVVRLRVTSKQGENAIDRILHLIEEAESHKAPLERFLDRFSRWYTPAMMLLALFVIITPPLLFGQLWETWIYRGLALLLIACPCALVISTPAAITSGLAVAAKRGALIKGGAALEQLGRIETIAFDKTGTLTRGKPEVTDVIPSDGYSDTELLQRAAAVETGSNHPLAVSLVSFAKAQGVKFTEADERRAMAGVGVEGLIGNERYRVLSPAKSDLLLESGTEKKIIELEEQGKTVVLVARDDTVIGIIALQDTLREDAAAAISELKKLGIETLMLTGDNERSAMGISQQIGIGYKAGLLPEDKVRYVRQLSDVRQVAMVGDGINDAPAMKASSTGIAMGSGTDVALEAADSALTHNRLTDIPGIIKLSRSTLTNIRQNITIALGLKGVFLVTSLLGITGLWVAVLADSGATVLVTANALRLLRLSKQ